MNKKHKNMLFIAAVFVFATLIMRSASHAQMGPPPDSSFSGFNMIAPVPGVPICAPLVMNWDNLAEPDRVGPPAGTQQWFVQAIGNQVRITLSVTNHGRQTVNVVPLTGGPPPAGFPFTIDSTNLCQPGMFGGFLSNEGSRTFAAVPGTIYRVFVTLNALQVPTGCTGGPPDSGRHYSLRALGVKALATTADPATLSTLEYGAQWLIHHDTAARSPSGFPTFQ